MKHNGKEVYGFEVHDSYKNYIKTWFNGSSSYSVDKKEEPEMYQMYLAQSPLGFSAALNYCKIRAKELGLELQYLYEEDYKALGNPVTKFFRKLFKRNKDD